MLLKKFNPTTPSLRSTVLIKNTKLAKRPLIKSRIIGSSKSGGRSNTGRISVNHKGGGHKKRYRKINFFRNLDSNEVVLSVEYDPSRTANIASLYNKINHNYSYIISPSILKPGDIVKSGYNLNEYGLGFSLQLFKVPIGSRLYNISKKNKGNICRAAGTYGTLLDTSEKYCQLKLKSGKRLFISKYNFACLGIVSNTKHLLNKKGKAGRKRWLNVRPTVRGVAMNPVDHPHGGGEGKTSGRKVLVSPWGKLAKK